MAGSGFLQADYTEEKRMAVNGFLQADYTDYTDNGWRVADFSKRITRITDGGWRVADERLSAIRHPLSAPVPCNPFVEIRCPFLFRVIRL